MRDLYEAVLNGDARKAAAAARAAMDSGADPLGLVTGELAPAMDEVGRRFQCEEYFVPELLLAARAMKAAMEPITPLLKESGAESAGRVVIGTVKGDLHDIGKNLVAAMLEGGGFEVVDLGADVSPTAFVQAVRDRNAQIVCLSALLTVTMRSMKTTVDAIEAAGLRRQVTVLVGGAPVSERFAKEIGADGYAEDAPGAVTLARRFMAARIHTR